MKKNMGSIDKLIRLAIAAIIVVLFFMKIITGTLGIVLLVIAGVSVLTSLISYCPLYPVVGLSTTKGEEKKDTK
ncbi:MAG: YgaP family membrane protein [Bacteroidales bacterium]